MMKTLVAYFSASGVTKRVAERLARGIGADTFEIEPARPYTPADLDWRDETSRSTLESKDAQARPELACAPESPVPYDTVLIGFPIWWYTAPAIIKTYLEAADFSGVRIGLFATSGGSGIGGTLGDLKPCAPAARWTDAHLFSASASEEELAAWAKGLGC